MYLVYDQRECYYKMIIASSNHDLIHDSIKICLADLKMEIRNNKSYHVYKVNRYKHNEVCQRMFETSMPLKAARELATFKSEGQAQYKDNKLPTYCHDITINLKSFTELREYQTEALNAVISMQGDKIYAKNGYIVLPCGAGKTLLGISILTKIKK